MESTKTWGEALTTSLISVVQKFVYFFPTILGALLVLIFGWILSVALGKMISKIVGDYLGLDRMAEKIGIKRNSGRNGMFLSPSVLIGGLFKWFLALVFLMAATSILGLDQVTVFLNSIVFYIPNVIVAVIILAFVFLLGNFVYHLIKHSTRAMGLTSATLIAGVSKWAIIVFGIFAALIQLGIVASLVNTIFIGMVAMLSLAGGLAFGLGGKEEAQLILRKIREELTENHKL
jgi:hypothetical protein